MSVHSVASTTATVSCTVAGITTAAVGIKWYDSTGNTQLTDTDTYTVVDGTIDGAGEQTTTLTVTDGVAADTAYKCEIGGTKYQASINVYSK